MAFRNLVVYALAAIALLGLLMGGYELESYSGTSNRQSSMSYPPVLSQNLPISPLLLTEPNKDLQRLQNEKEEPRHQHLGGKMESTLAATTGNPTKESKESSAASTGIIKEPKLVFGSCTALQKKVVRYQTRGDQPGTSLLGDLTRCPDSTNWLGEFYHNSQWKDTSDFLAVNVGCNKGYDSLHLLRMGTRQASILKKPWEAALGDVASAFCGANNHNLPLPHNSVPRRGDVFCIEPMPTTIKALQKASKATAMEEKGLHIVHAAVSNEIGTAQFPVTNRAGVENVGISWKDSNKQYVEVPLMTLDEFGKRHMTQYSDQNINVLLIDTEGYDFEVMKGAGEMLQRVEYLEFEFHAVRKWLGHELKEAIDMLDDKGFTCYWAGKKKLWRITNCWQNYFRYHQMANVACVHNELKPELATKMEQVFLETIRYQWPIHKRE